MVCVSFYFVCFFFKQKTAYEMRISDWSSDVCSSDLGIFLRIDRMRRAVGAEEKFGRARGGGGAHREPVPLALGDRQAIGVRADAADQHRIAIDVQMMRCDRRGDRKSTRLNSSH